METKKLKPNEPDKVGSGQVPMQLPNPNSVLIQQQFFIPGQKK